MKFGQSREHFEDSNQTKLPLDIQTEVLEEQEVVIKQEITYSRTKKKHPGRASLPSHLPVEEIEIYPEGDLSDKVCIGTETTDELDYVAAILRLSEILDINTPLNTKKIHKLVSDFFQIEPSIKEYLQKGLLVRYL